MYLAIKEIKKEKTRFVMIILVTALIAYLVYFLSSLAYGLAQINRTAIDHWHANGIVLSRASNENIYGSSIELEDVATLNLSLENTINVTNTTVTLKGDTENLFNVVFLGYDTNNERVAANLVEGRGIRAENEVIISSNIKETTNISLDSTLKVSSTGREFKVVGFTEDSNFNTVPVAYVNRDMASSAMMTYTTGNDSVDASATPTPNMPKRVSAILTFEAISQDTLDEYDLVYIPIDTFISGLPGYQAQVLTFGLMIISLALISAIIIGIFMYILTMQKRSVFGVLKIQGYANGYIMRSVMYQTFLLTALGFGLGLSLTVVTVALMPARVPVSIFWGLFLLITGFSLLCSLLGALVSARSILKIDPLEAL